MYVYELTEVVCKISTSHIIIIIYTFFFTGFTSQAKMTIACIFIPFLQSQIILLVYLLPAVISQTTLCTLHS